jgi:hypothetical protein
MSATSLLVLFSPLLVLALLLCAVMAVAIWRARPEDVPSLASAFLLAFGRLVDWLPRGPQWRSRIHDKLDPKADNRSIPTHEDEQ